MNFLFDFNHCRLCFIWNRTCCRHTFKRGFNSVEVATMVCFIHELFMKTVPRQKLLIATTKFAHFPYILKQSCYHCTPFWSSVTTDNRPVTPELIASLRAMRNERFLADLNTFAPLSLNCNHCIWTTMKYIKTLNDTILMTY